MGFDKLCFLDRSGHWAWLPLPYFVASGQPCPPPGLSGPVCAMGRHRLYRSPQN